MCVWKTFPKYSLNRRIFINGSNIRTNKRKETVTEEQNIHKITYDYYIDDNKDGYMIVWNGIQVLIQCAKVTGISYVDECENWVDRKFVFVSP